MALTVSVTEEQVFTALRTFLLYVIGSSFEVVRELDNRVPMPKAFALMNLLNKKRLGWTRRYYTDTPSVGTAPGVHLVTEVQPIESVIQVDFYGPTSGDQATTLSSVWNTPQAVEFFQASGITPLYSEDPRQAPITDGENQWLVRWLVVLHMQYTPMVDITQDFMDAATIELINVDQSYPV